jgi:hypothetical protein
MRCQHYVKNKKPWKAPRYCKREAKWLVTVKVHGLVPHLPMLAVDRVLCSNHAHTVKGTVVEKL